MIELSIKALEEALDKEGAGKIKALSQDLTEAAMKLGEAIYKAQADSEEADDGAPSGVDDDIVDADFEDVDDNRRK